jgi:hypothetical protein
MRGNGVGSPCFGLRLWIETRLSELGGLNNLTMQSLGNRQKKGGTEIETPEDDWVEG